MPGCRPAGPASLISGQQRSLDRGDLVALGEYVVGERPISLLQCAEPDGLPKHGVACGAGVADDRRVLVADPLEEVDLLKQLREAVRLEDHGHQVRLCSLVFGP